MPTRDPEGGATSAPNTEIPCTMAHRRSHRTRPAHQLHSHANRPACAPMRPIVHESYKYFNWHPHRMQRMKSTSKPAHRITSRVETAGISSQKIELNGMHPRWEPAHRSQTPDGRTNTGHDSHTLTYTPSQQAKSKRVTSKGTAGQVTLATGCSTSGDRLRSASAGCSRG